MVPADSIYVKIPAQRIYGDPKKVSISFSDIDDDEESLPKITFNSIIQPTKSDGYYEYSISKEEIFHKFCISGNAYPPPIVKVTVTDLVDDGESIFSIIFRPLGRSDYEQYQILQ